MPDYSAGVLLADQAVLLLNMNRGTQMLQPRRRETATGTASSSSLIPQDETGSAINQSPLWGADAARNVAICTGSEMEDLTTARDAKIPGLSQKDCLQGSRSDAGSEPKVVCQLVRWLIKVDISGAGGDRQNLRLEIRGARSRNQVGG